MHRGAQPMAQQTIFRFSFFVCFEVRTRASNNSNMFNVAYISTYSVVLGVLRDVW